MTLPLPDPADSASGRAGLDPRFEVLEELGRGGHGVVYRARDRLRGGLQVALKVVLGDLTPQRRARLAREARLVRSLDHPGVVPLLDAEVEGRRPWLSFRLIPGARTLDQAWPELPLRRRLELLLEVAQALAYAHARGVVHRDVKPENILLEGPRARLADFGLGTDREANRLTLTGAQIGTPRTMAPEQLHATRDGIGPAADVWALGVLLYLLLTERYPFQAEDMVTLMTRVVSERPARPSQLVPDVPPALESLCLEALAKQPGDRPRDAGAFAERLEAGISALGVARSPARRAPRVAGAILLAGAAGAGLLLRAAGTRPGAPPGNASSPSPNPDASQPASTATASPPVADQPADLLALDLGAVLAQAEAGTVWAMRELGARYLLGRGGAPRDPAQAAVWLRRAGEAGDLDSLTNYAVMLATGDGVPQDVPAAIEAYSRAAEAGDPRAQGVLGFRLIQGDGLPADPARGIEWLRRAAAAGDPVGSECLARAYEAGRHVPKDSREAERLYRQAAAGGRGAAMALLGDMLARGANGAPDPEAGRRWLERGAATGDPQALHMLGRLHYQQGELERACAVWSRAALLDFPAAQRDLAIAQMNGEGTPQDEAAARVGLRRAAEAGDAQGMHGLGVSLREGRGGPRDLEQATAWFARAAEAGYVPGMANYGRALRDGEGVPRDPAAATVWLTRASEAGDAPSQRMLAALLSQQGRASDAAAWMERAVAGGDPVAHANLSLMLRRGQGIARDPARAHQLAQRAAELGEAMGWVYLGDDCYDGGVVPQDVAQALRHWERGYELGGAAAAAYRLGLAHAPGGRAPTDVEAARRWLEAARAGGHSMADEQLRKLGR